jgi:hypothetical protein
VNVRLQAHVGTLLGSPEASRKLASPILLVPRESMGVLTPGSVLFGMLGLMALLLVGVAIWVVLATSKFVQGGNVENSGRVAQLYGYTVCLVAVVTFLISVSSIIGAVFDLASPLEADRQFFDASLTSLEAYKATYQRASEIRFRADQTKPDTFPEPVLRARYEALRADQIARVHFQGVRSLTTSSVMLLLSVVLFGVHWRWLRKRSAAATSSSAPAK